MHELSLCGAIADIVTRRAGERVVDVVHVRVGQLRQVVPDTLTFCWSLVTSETTLDGSVLDVERVDAVMVCGACRDEHGLGDALTFVCPRCGSPDAEVVAGDELMVTALDLVEA